MIHLIDNYHLDSDGLCWILKQETTPDPNKERKEPGPAYRIIGYYDKLKHAYERLAELGIQGLDSLEKIVKKQAEIYSLINRNRP